ncbi:DNA-binding domain-containing protein [Legionella israelensis]|uniref:Uncharacterized protein n=1 Tax=Legionella israelensis TaxID=454 RepID=A0A0W0WE81_9GAMM|nr:putative DNA-binding domain-containing protein [Legionella israelensis]KTD30531.1 hypothetical protein Lisr_0713 [Legionella israelensis]QBS10287.1 hypothetical protein E4T55_10710 [Legionella israelensis]SCY39139.1 hypothetical protein SAMN02746069_02279 [Legionella israelensis DSM 19235]STX59887.1 Uncharacterized protein conserved in bacteria [Legionella israelensis]
MSEALKQLQNAFSFAARGHDNAQTSAFDKKRLTIYRELLLNNLHDVVSPCFPVLLSILPKKIWWGILKDFLKHHQVLTPIFHEVPLCMVEYLKAHPVPGYPFAHELAHYEWVELEVELCEPQNTQPTAGAISLLEQAWQLSNTARLLQYNYEVDKISPDYQPQTVFKTYLMVYQMKGEVEFLKINEMSFQLLSMMLHETMSAREIIHSLCEMHPQLNENELVSACIPFITQLYDEKILQPVSASNPGSKHG